MDVSGSEGARIWIVDDNEMVAKALATLLSKSGYQTSICHSAGEALEMASQPDRTTPVAAVVDIHLPDLSGLILSDKLREQFGPDLPIIIVSGDTSMETLNSLPHVGATYFFSKPLNTGTFLDRLKQMAGGKC